MTPRPWMDELAVEATLRRDLDEAREKLRGEEERHALLQARCYEGYPSASDGVFDALTEAARERDEALDALRLAEAAMVDLGACDDCTHVDCAQPLLKVRAVLSKHPKVNS